MNTPAPRLHNKVSIITGAAQGIGLATALKFAHEGAIVVVCDVKQAAVDDAVQQCLATGAQAIGLVVDVTQRTMVDAMVKTVLEKFGRIDVLVNNAGIFKAADGHPDNQVLAGMYLTTVNQTHLFRRRGLVNKGSLQASNDEHRAILQALARHDPDAAARALEAHVAKGWERLAEAGEAGATA